MQDVLTIDEESTGLNHSNREPTPGIPTYKRAEIPTGIVDQVKWWALKGKTRKELKVFPYNYRPGTIRVAFRELVVRGELIETKQAPLNAYDLKERAKERHRKGYIGTIVDGEHVVLEAPNKRSWPGHCELCRSEFVTLAYHHWDGSNPSKGIWLCHKHHVFAEMVDRGLVNKYLLLKAGIEEEFVGQLLREEV